MHAYCFRPWSSDFLKTFCCPPATEQASVTCRELETEKRDDPPGLRVCRRVATPRFTGGGQSQLVPGPRLPPRELSVSGGAECRRLNNRGACRVGDPLTRPLVSFLAAGPGFCPSLHSSHQGPRAELLPI